MVFDVGEFGQADYLSKPDMPYFGHYCDLSL